MFLSLVLLALNPATPEASTSAAPKDPVVCQRSRGSSLGTNIAQPRVCKKKSEWDAQAREARRNLQRTQDRRSDPFKVPGGQPIPQ
jgi:hypothetical protein